MNLGKVADEEVAQADQKSNEASGEGVPGASVITFVVVTAIGRGGEDDKAGELEILANRDVV